MENRQGKKGMNLVSPETRILITGAKGFIGSEVLLNLVGLGFRNIRCLVRDEVGAQEIVGVAEQNPEVHFEILQGNLRRKKDCRGAVKNVEVVFHLASGFGKSFKKLYGNTVYATRNLMEAAAAEGKVSRFVLVSSFTVYFCKTLGRNEVLDEKCETYKEPGLKGDGYCCGKVMQEEIVRLICEKNDIPYVILRPGAVYGPGNRYFSGRIGLRRGKVFLDFAGANQVPLSYVENCAEAIALAGVKKYSGNRIFNVVDDGLPDGSLFIREYRKNVENLWIIKVPRFASYLFCLVWEKISRYSGGRLPATFNTYRWSDEWKGHRYTNRKLKEELGWEPGVDTRTGMRNYFEFCRKIKSIPKEE